MVACMKKARFAAQLLGVVCGAFWLSLWPLATLLEVASAANKALVQLEEIPGKCRAPETGYCSQEFWHWGRYLQSQH